VQYASALAWLVRAAGYPSRVAFGFTEGTLMPGGKNTYQLTNENLHAWTEVYFSGFGWVPFDATPSTDVPGSIRTAWAPDANNAQNTNTGPSVAEPTPGAGAGGPSASSKTHFKNDPDNLAGGGTGGSNGANWAWWLLVAAVAVLVIAAAPFVARIVLRARRAAADRRTTSETAEPGEPYVVVEEQSTSASSKRRVHAAWDEFIDILVDYRVPVDPAETPRSTAERVVRSLDLGGEAAKSTRLIGSSEERARYARRPGPGQSLEAGLATIRHTLASRVSLRTRLRAQLLPPSVTQRWAAWTVTTVSNTVARAQALRESVSRLLSFRRFLSPRRLMAQRSSR
jgi:hypothetical protein